MATSRLASEAVARWIASTKQLQPGAMEAPVQTTQRRINRIITELDALLTRLQDSEGQTRPALTGAPTIAQVPLDHEQIRRDVGEDIRFHLRTLTEQQIVLAGSHL
jgi:hypothetical protein